ncbi:ornithine carbamoyltransferase [candidate division BRC1 bacterium HGW-BRC1-1]|jgi:ornithine carbamoyltransferase|nr:MAG: ornithine carbamoyltransferase [candidate division BRC1 bacterium HGW-BRC1-1]
MTTRDYLKSSDFDREKTLELFELAAGVKQQVKQRHFLDLLSGCHAAMIFQKPSLRTRVTFDIGLKQLGATGIYLSPAEISLGVRESVYDVARNLERWVDLVIARVFEQAAVEELAQVGAPPVINALSDDEHPCQAMADFFTLYERGVQWNDFHFTYVGDGNNVCNSLMITGAILGLNLRIGSPARYAPSKALIEQTQALCRASGGSLLITDDPREAVRGANAVYTDVWASMGQEEEAGSRKAFFEPFQVNAELMKLAAKDAFFMHDLPAHRGEEVTDEVIDGPTSLVFDQAENRLHIQKAIILEVMDQAEAARATF